MKQHKNHNIKKNSYDFIKIIHSALERQSIRREGEYLDHAMSKKLFLMVVRREVRSRYYD